MTATEELRAELTKRGIEWRWEDERTTYWYATVYGEEWGEWTATEMGGYLHLSFMSCDVLTPAEVIAATLGDIDATRARQGDTGTCMADETDTIKCWVKCKDEPSVEHVELIHVMECSSCGGTYEHVNGDYEFCPRCGAKVVDE